MTSYINSAGTKVLVVAESQIGAPSVTLVISVTENSEEIRIGPSAFIAPIGFSVCELEHESILTITQAAARMLLNGLGVLRDSEAMIDIVKNEIRRSALKAKIQKEVAGIEDPDSLRLIEAIRSGEISTLDDLESPEANSAAKAVANAYKKIEETKDFS